MYQLKACSRCGATIRHGNSKYCRECKKAVERERQASSHSKELSALRWLRNRKPNYDPQREHERYLRRKARKIETNRIWKQENAERVVHYEIDRKDKKRASGGHVSVSEWEDMKASYLGKCVYCGAPANTIDHVIPIALGGAHDPENIAPACLWCNSQKGAKTLLGFMFHRLYIDYNPALMLVRWASGEQE